MLLVTDRTAVPELVTLVGLIVVERPGVDTTDSEMVPVKPFTAVRVIVEVPEVPVPIVTVLGVAVIVKSGCGPGVTVIARLTECESVPLIPVTKAP